MDHKDLNKIKNQLNNIDDHLLELISEKRESPRNRAMSKMDATINNEQLILKRLKSIEISIDLLFDKLDEILKSK